MASRSRSSLGKALRVDFKSRIRFSLQGKCDCDDYCASEGVCRSFQASSVDFSSVDLLSIASDALGVARPSKQHRRADRASLLLRGYDSELDVYCLERVLVHAGAYLPSRWEFRLVTGYYGQELDSLRLEDGCIEECVAAYESIVAHEGLGERARALLTLEYGTVLPLLEGCEWSIDTVPRSRVLFPQTRHMERASRGDVYSERPSGAIMGVCKREGDSYRVVDGYHRLTQTNQEHVTIITAHDKD